MPFFPTVEQRNKPEGRVARSVRGPAVSVAVTTVCLPFYILKDCAYV